ncbi:MAG: sensor histidine kinase [Nitrospirae bacterium]|nr:MAG: sensor histidine kinase [Nitrospirota bacterium]
MPEDQTTDTRLGSAKDMLLSPIRTAAAIRNDRYKSLKVRIFFTVGTLAGVPLLIVTAVCFFWLHAVLVDDFSRQLRWQMEHAQEGLESFLQDRVSSTRYFASVHSYGALSKEQSLRTIFRKSKQEFPELIDLEVLSSGGKRVSYAGPYADKSSNYANHDWFIRAKVHGVAISQVFPGDRNILHYIIAVRQEMPGREGFWILRASFDVETLTRFVAEIELSDRDDAFLVAGNDMLQTTSRLHGAALERVSLPVLSQQKVVSIAKIDDEVVGKGIFGSVKVQGSPWTLVAIIKPATLARIASMLKREILAVYLVIVFVAIGILMNYRTTQRIVNRIRETEKAREEAIAHSEHSAKLASIGRLATGVAHEINNPLAIINEKAGLIKDLFEVHPESSGCQKEFLPLVNAISDSVGRCRTITHRLLGFARRMEIDIEQINVNEVLREVVGFLEREIVVRNIRLELNLDDKLPHIESDRGLLQQVFLNIANNAMDAVKDGGEIGLSTMTATEGGLKIVIRDDGAGIRFLRQKRREGARDSGFPCHTASSSDLAERLRLTVFCTRERRLPSFSRSVRTSRRTDNETRKRASGR